MAVFLSSQKWDCLLYGYRQSIGKRNKHLQEIPTDIIKLCIMFYGEAIICWRILTKDLRKIIQFNLSKPPKRLLKPDVFESNGFLFQLSVLGEYAGNFLQLQIKLQSDHMEKYTINWRVQIKYDDKETANQQDIGSFENMTRRIHRK